MGNRKLEHCQSHVNTTPPTMLEAVIIETQKQHARVGVTQTLDASIITTILETCTLHRCC
jgi:hypothetical protein